MADTIRDEAALQTLLADNTSNAISPQDLRDFLVSVPSLASTANLALTGGTMTGNLLFTDNTYDIGASGASRPRTLYIGTSIVGAVDSNTFGYNTIQTQAIRVTSAAIAFANAGTVRALCNFANTNVGLMLSQDLPITWANNSGNANASTFQSGTADTGIRRNAAGVIEINNGTAGTYRDLIVRALNPSGGSLGIGTTTPSGSYALDVAGAIRASTFMAAGTLVMSGTTGVYVGASGTGRYGFGAVQTSGAYPLVIASGDATYNDGFILFQTQGLERARIQPNGNVGVGGSNATTATAGFFCVNSSAGIPTGVPASIPTGTIPLQYDSTNNRLYAYNGAWRMVALA